MMHPPDRRRLGSRDGVLRSVGRATRPVSLVVIEPSVIPGPDRGQAVLD